MPPFILDFFTKHLWNILSVTADILVVAFVGYSVWMVFHPKPTTTQNETAQVINNYTIYPDNLKFVVGKVGGFELLSYHSVPSTSKVITKVTK